MATQIHLEKGSGDATSYGIPVLVYNDDNADLTVADAITAAEAAAPSSILGVNQDGVPTVEERTNFCVRVTVRYASAGSVSFALTDFQDDSVVAETLKYTYADPIARFPGTAPDVKGMLSFDGTEVVIPPGQGGPQRRFDLNVVSMTSAYRKLIYNATRAGAVHNGPLAGYAAGELQIVRASIRQKNSNTFSVSVQWSYKPNVNSATYGDVTGVSHQGHDLVSVFPKPVVDRNGNTIAQRPAFVYVTRPRPLLDISGIATPPAIG